VEALQTYPNGLQVGGSYIQLLNVWMTQIHIF
jgi:hypothetical protein